MKTDITKVSSSAFAMTFTSANKEDYPVLYSDDQWHMAKKGDDVCKLYDVVNGSKTSNTGAQFTQDEINQTFARAINSNTTSSSQFDYLDKRIDDVSQSIVGLYHYCGTVATKDDLPRNASHGDVYNTSEDGMNYAYVFIPEAVYTSDGAKTTGQDLYNVWDTVFNNHETRKMRLLVNGVADDYVIGATSGYKIYAFKTSGSGSGSGVQSSDFVDLSSYDQKRGQYTKTSNSAVFY